VADSCATLGQAAVLGAICSLHTGGSRRVSLAAWFRPLSSDGSRVKLLP
jgi:hypothetical protein